MTVLKDILAGLKTAIELNGKLVAVSDSVKALAEEVRDMDRRLVRVETVIEIARPAEGAVLRIADRGRGDDRT